MASSNTVLRPRCVNAEHSRYFTESVGRKAGAVMRRKKIGVGSGGIWEFAVKGPDSEENQCRRRRNTTGRCQAERDARACVSEHFWLRSPHSHSTLLPQCLFCRQGPEAHA